MWYSSGLKGNLWDMSTKECQHCRTTKSKEEFPPNKSRKDGLHPVCRDCKRNYHRKHYSHNKRKYVEAAIKHNALKKQLVVEFVNWLKSVPCTDCGNSFPPECMDFDHLRDKKYGISAIVGGRVCGIREMWEEIQKCEVVCSNCHRTRTKNRNLNLCGGQVELSD